MQAGLVIAAAGLSAYPVLRPYGPESGAAGVADLGSTAWLVAHALGMLGFAALAFALRAAARDEAACWRWTGRPVHEAESRAWVAVVLLLPYYGAEAYGMNEVARYAGSTGDPQVLGIVESFRYAPWRSARSPWGCWRSRWSGLDWRWGCGGPGRPVGSEVCWPASGW